MKIAIIGAGYSGMSIAKELAKDNEIVIFEKEKEVRRNGCYIFNCKYKTRKIL